MLMDLFHDQAAPTALNTAYLLGYKQGAPMELNTKAYQRMVKTLKWLGENFGDSFQYIKYGNAP